MKLRCSKLAAVGIVSACASLAGVHAQGPAWWTEREVLVTNASPSDFAPANQGQVKHITHQAYLEMQAALPGGAGPEVAAMIAEFLDANNYLPANLGQLKHVAKPFYDRLIEVGYTTNYPWAGGDPADYAPANIGQVKNLFAFDVALDTDGDGLPDWWEELYGLDPLDDGSIDSNNGPADDPDDDGLTNIDEFLWGTDPHNWDTDGDLLMDGREVTHYLTDPARWDSSGWIGLSDALQKLTGDQWPGLAMQITDTWPCSGCVCLIAAPTEVTEYYDFYGYYYDFANNNAIHYQLLAPSISGGDGSTQWTDCSLALSFYVVGYAHDSDGDGISDSYEVLILGTSPDKIDSSMPPNGISDADEDFDGDGLTNLEEYFLKTNPWNPDTDGDGLSDGEEIALGTDPLTPNEPAAITILFPQNGFDFP